MNSKYYIGSQVQSLDILNKTKPITEVCLWLDEDNCVVSGANDGTGYTLEANCPSATQAMADAILASVQNRQYQGLRGDNAMISMFAELGDGMDIGGMYTLIANETVKFGTDMWNVAAPIEDELEEEYPYVSPAERAARRAVSQAMASLSVLEDTITAEITDRENADANLSSRIEQTLSSISFTVTNGSDSSTLSMTATKEDGSTITIGSQNITFNGVVTFTDLSTAGSTTINGSNITTGTISASRLDASVITSTDLSTEGGTVINGSNISTGTIDAQYIASDISQVDYYLNLGGSGDSSCGILFGNDPSAYIKNYRNGSTVINSGYDIEISADDGVFVGDGIAPMHFYTAGRTAVMESRNSGGKFSVYDDGDVEILGEASIYLQFNDGAYFEFSEGSIDYYNNSGVHVSVWRA